MRHPVSVIVFGALCIAFGLFGLFGTSISIAVHWGSAQPTSAIERVLYENERYVAMTSLGLLLGVGTSTLQFAAGVGLLLLKRWGRVLAVTYAIVSLASSLILTPLTALFVWAPLWSDPRLSAPREHLLVVGSVVGGAVSPVISACYAGLLWFFMTRPRVVAAFSPGAERASPW